MDRKILLFADMYKSIEYWSKVATSSILGEESDFAWARNADAFVKVAAEIGASNVSQGELESVFRDCFFSVANSFLTILDGATAMSNDGRLLYLTDENGNSIGEGLHDEFASYLLDRISVEGE